MNGPGFALDAALHMQVNKLFTSAPLQAIKAWYWRKSGNYF